MKGADAKLRGTFEIPRTVTGRIVLAPVVLAGRFGFVNVLREDVVVAEAQQEQPDIPAALGRGGLKEAARVSGGSYTLRWDVEYHITPQSLRQLVAQSDLVIVGEVMENRCHLSKTGNYITTDYKVSVHERLRGAIEAGLPSVLVSIVGGKVLFEDGLTATVETPGFDRPVNGERLLLFLKLVPDAADYVAPATRQYANGAPVYRLVFGRASLWGISANENDRVTPKWQKPQNGALDYSGHRVETLLDDVRTVMNDLLRRR